MKLLAAAFLTASIGLGVSACSTLTAAQQTTVELPACPTEDSVGCRWDASTQGNGMGRSFIAYADGTLEYTR